MMLQFERQAKDLVIGIDEAGRGPLAGGVFAAAVTLPLERAEQESQEAWREVNDSKRLSASRRERLAEVIKNTPDCLWAIASATPAEIDRLNILRATHLAMRRAAQKVVDQIAALHTKATASILVDGLPVPELPCPSLNIIKGDSKSLFIAAASILAKTARDADCLRLEKLYPGYGFARHKAYPTKAHLEALRRLGPTPEHRKSFGPVASCNVIQTEMPLF